MQMVGNINAGIHGNYENRVLDDEEGAIETRFRGGLVHLQRAVLSVRAPIPWRPVTRRRL